MIEFRPIGIIHSPFKKTEGMPIQPAGAAGIKGTVEVFEDYDAGLKDLDAVSLNNPVFLTSHKLINPFHPL